jgi:hypothetical protein
MQNQEQRLLMPQPDTERTSNSHSVRVALGVILLLALGMLGFFIAYSHLPPPGSANPGTTNDFVTPTPVQTHPVAAMTVNRGVDYSGVHITVTQVQEAGAFSDDRKQGGQYTVRVYVHVENRGQAPVGINYSSQTWLVLPGGSKVASQLVTVAPVILPGSFKDGYFDFPLKTQVSLSSLALRLGSGTMVEFGG